MPTDPKKIVCLSGKPPAAVRQRIDKLGFKCVSKGLLSEDSKGRVRTHKSEIWRYDDPDGKTVHFVRIDEFGHEIPPDRAGANPHYHVDSCDKTQPGRDRHGNIVTDPDTGQPMSQDKHYEKTYEPNAATYNEEHNQVDKPNQPGAQNPAPDMDTWAKEVHHPIHTGDVVTK